MGRGQYLVELVAAFEAPYLVEDTVVPGVVVDQSGAEGAGAVVDVEILVGVRPEVPVTELVLCDRRHHHQKRDTDHRNQPVHRDVQHLLLRATTHHAHDDQDDNQEQREQRERHVHLAEQFERLELFLLFLFGGANVFVLLVLEELRHVAAGVQDREHVGQELPELVTGGLDRLVLDGCPVVRVEVLCLQYDRLELLCNLAVRVVRAGCRPDYLELVHPADREGVHKRDRIGQQRVYLPFAPARTDVREEREPAEAGEKADTPECQPRHNQYQR